MPDRSKVGKGNRKIVRDHFRKFGLELTHGQTLKNESYRFKLRNIYFFPYDQEEFDRELALAKEAAEALREVYVKVYVNRSQGLFISRPQAYICLKFDDPFYHPSDVLEYVGPLIDTNGYYLKPGERVHPAGTGLINDGMLWVANMNAPFYGSFSGFIEPRFLKKLIP